MAPAIRLRPATLSDLPEMVRIDVAAFRGSNPRLRFFPERLRSAPGDADVMEMVEQTTQRNMQSGAGRHFVVAVRERRTGNSDGGIGGSGSGSGGELASNPVAEEEIVGWARWQAPVREEDDPNAGKSAEELERMKQEFVARLPAGLDRDALFEFQGAVESMLERAFKGQRLKDMWSLGVVSVDPACQRQGIGSALVRYGLEEAQKSGEKVFLVAAPSGKPLYLSLGFRELEEIEVLEVTQAAMVWEPTKI